MTDASATLTSQASNESHNNSDTPSNLNSSGLDNFSTQTGPDDDDSSPVTMVSKADDLPVTYAVHLDRADFSNRPLTWASCRNWKLIIRSNENRGVPPVEPVEAWLSLAITQASDEDVNRTKEILRNLVRVDKGKLTPMRRPDDLFGAQIAKLSQLLDQEGISQFLSPKLFSGMRHKSEVLLKVCQEHATRPTPEDRQKVRIHEEYMDWLKNCCPIAEQAFALKKKWKLDKAQLQAKGQISLPPNWG